MAPGDPIIQNLKWSIPICRLDQTIALSVEKDYCRLAVFSSSNKQSYIYIWNESKVKWSIFEDKTMKSCDSCTKKNNFASWRKDSAEVLVRGKMLLSKAEKGKSNTRTRSWITTNPIISQLRWYHKQASTSSSNLLSICWPKRCGWKQRVWCEKVHDESWRTTKKTTVASQQCWIPSVIAKMWFYSKLFPDVFPRGRERETSEPS